MTIRCRGNLAQDGTPTVVHKQVYVNSYNLYAGHECTQTPELTSEFQAVRILSSIRSFNVAKLTSDPFFTAQVF